MSSKQRRGETAQKEGGSRKRGKPPGKRERFPDFVRKNPRSLDSILNGIESNGKTFQKQD